MNAMYKKCLCSCIIALLLSGCTYAESSRLSDNDLNYMYPSIKTESNYLVSREMTLADIIQISQMIIEVELAAPPEHMTRSFTYEKDAPEAALPSNQIGNNTYSIEYVNIRFKIISSLKSSTTLRQIEISVPERNASFAYAMNDQSRYIVCVIPAKNLGPEYYDTITSACFYVSTSGQVIPFDEKFRESEVMGLSLSEFRQYVGR